LSEKPVPVAKPLTETKPAPPSPAPKPAHAEPKPPVAAATPKAPPKAEAKQAAPPPPPAPKPAAHPAGGNDYGPVAEGETLSGIARATKPDDKSSVNQMMLALLKANPNAFYQDNINALKRGSILRIPSSDEIRAKGTLREAAEQVHSQNEVWTTGRAAISKPTLVAHTGATTKTTTEPAAKPASRCETGEAGASGAGAAECRKERHLNGSRRPLAETGRKMPGQGRTGPDQGKR
jgi:pilus assembly protein FimV